MFNSLNNVLDCSLLLLALINPISKIFIISTFSQDLAHNDIRHVVIKSTMIAMLILLTFTFLGNFILSKIFHVQLYSFQIAGGIVLAFRGFEALKNGLFFEVGVNQKFEDLSVVPLASPMIAGPATLTAAVSFPSKYGLLVTCIAIVISISINLIIMLLARTISSILDKYNIMGALIRITGLIVATIGIQMMLDGTFEFLSNLQNSFQFNK